MGPSSAPQEVAHAFEVQDVPFERVVSQLNPARDPARTPVFQVLFQLRNLPRPSQEWAGLEVTPISVHTGTCKTDLSLDVTECDGGLLVHAEYNVALFKPSTIGRWLAQLERLVDGMLEHPECPIASLDLLDSADRALVPDPSRPLPPPPQPRFRETIRRRFQEDPDAVALRQHDRAWTRRQFDQATTRLARRIGSLLPASCTNPVVAVSGSRSFGLIVAVAAVLEAPAVLLTLDPATPESRRLHVLSRGDARLLLCVDSPDATDPALAGFPRLIVDPLTGSELPSPGLPPQIPLSPTDSVPNPDAPAYLFFTSGTTGTPKAILGRTRGFDHFLQWQQSTFDIGPGDRAAQLTGLAFDAVLRDIFTPLAGGACLHLPIEGSDNAPDQVIAWLARERITVVHAVPSLARAWLRSAPPALRLPELRLAFFAGEPLTDALVEQWRLLAPGCRIINLYGPTETTLAKCFHEVSHPPLPGIQPIGRPFPCSQALVLHPGRGLCTVGEPGEIAIRTPFRSLGYLPGSAEGQSPFVPNPWRSDPDDLLYLTGDLGRFRPDGTLDILGRTDDQVKVHGVRIEPAGIAATLSRLPDVRECVVLARTLDDGGKQLVAFVVAESTPPSNHPGPAGAPPTTAGPSSNTCRRPTPAAWSCSRPPNWPPKRVAAPGVARMQRLEPLRHRPPGNHPNSDRSPRHLHRTPPSRTHPAHGPPAARHRPWPNTSIPNLAGSVSRLIPCMTLTVDGIRHLHVADHPSPIPGAG